MTRDSIHAGHRDRLRQRFVNEGLTHFSDHQILELLLFYAIPRTDTNRTAHSLIAKFGSLSAVLDADVSQLCLVEGIGKNAAIFLHSLPAVLRRYHSDGISRKTPVLNHVDAVNDYLKPLMVGRTEEVFYLVCLDNQLRIKHSEQISVGTVNAAFVHPRKVVEVALAHRASAVVLAHNHPSGSLTPSASDKALTRQLETALNAIDIKVIDHIIVADDDCFSFAQMGLMASAN